MRLFAIPVLLFAVALLLSDSPSSLGQFRGGGPGGPSGFGGFGGPGGSMAFLLKDPQALFERMARGRDHFLISETFSLREPLTQFAKDKGITDDKVTLAHFTTFAEQMKAKMAPATDAASPGTPTATGDDARIEFEFRRRDNNNDGILDLKEMNDSLRDDLRRWDRNGSNTIDLDEYKVYYVTRQQERNERDKGANVTVIEVNEEELNRRPVVLRAGKLPKELEVVFKELDADQDGQIDMVEWRKAGKALAEFKDMDRNDDGLLIPEEVLRYQNQPKTAQLATGENGGKPSSFGGFGRSGFGKSGFGKGGFGRPEGGNSGPGGGSTDSRFKKPGG